MQRDTEFPKHVVVVTGLVVRNGQFLAGQRVDWDSSPGQWCLPGGKVEENESLEQTLRQEVLEEANVEIENPVHVADKDFHDKLKNHYIVICYKCDYVSGEPRPGDDMQTMQWITPEEFLKKDNILFETGDVIKKVFDLK